MSRETCGGRIVKDYPEEGYFLREDPVTKYEGIEKHPYSLFKDEPYGRVMIFINYEEGAIEWADEYVRDEHGS